MAKEIPAWLGKHPVLDEDHHASLEAAAAEKEFRHGKPRDQAESEAHADYLKDKALDCAAHHYVGIKTAHAGGNMSAAKKHGAQFVAAMEAAGEDPHTMPGPKLMDRIQQAKAKVYSFKTHEADHLFPAQEVEESPPADAEMQQKIANLKRIAQDLKLGG